MGLLDFFAPDGTYTDVAMGATYTGRDGIARLHRFMLKFSPDSVIEFGDGHASDGRLYLDRVWTVGDDRRPAILLHTAPATHRTTEQAQRFGEEPADSAGRQE